MGALARLLVKVSKRVLTHNPTNEVLLQTADRVVLWRNADYITDAQVEEIAAVMPEPEPSTEPQEAAEGADEGEEVSTHAESEGEPESAEKPLEDMTKAELLAYAQEHGIEAYESWTKAEIIAAIEGAE